MTDCADMINCAAQTRRHRERWSMFRE